MRSTFRITKMLSIAALAVFSAMGQAADIQEGGTCVPPACPNPTQIFFSNGSTFGTYIPTTSRGVCGLGQDAETLSAQVGGTSVECVIDFRDTDGYIRLDVDALWRLPASSSPWHTDLGMIALSPAGVLLPAHVLKALREDRP